MFSICFASFLFIMSSSVYSIPISGTHAVVGGVLGAGLAITSVDKLNTSSLLSIVIQWFASPLISMAISFVLMTLASLLTLQTGKTTYRFRILSAQLVATLSFLVIGEMIWTLIRGKQHENEPLTYHHFVFSLNFMVVGLVLSRLVLFLSPRYLGKVSKSNEESTPCKIASLFVFWNTSAVEELTREIEVGETVEMVEAAEEGMF